MTHTELAWEFADIFAQLSPDRLNELIAKNVPFETLEFFRSYAESVARSEALEGDTAERLPNLLLIGYLIRVLEERLIDEPKEGPLL